MCNIKNRNFWPPVHWLLRIGLGAPDNLDILRKLGHMETVLAAFINISTFVTIILKLYYLCYILLTPAIEMHHKQFCFEIEVAKIGNFTTLFFDKYITTN